MLRGSDGPSDFQRLRRCGNKNDAVEPEMLERVFSREQVADMWGVEAAAEDGETHRSATGRRRARQRDRRSVWCLHVAADARDLDVTGIALPQLGAGLGEVVAVSNRLVRLGPPQQRSEE